MNRAEIETTRDRDRETRAPAWRPLQDESWPSLWESFFPRRRLADFYREGGERMGAFVPAVEVSENEASYIVSVEVPGAKKEDIQVDLREGMLVIHGEKRCEREENKERSHYAERCYGSFSRAFTLPNDADPERLEAAFKDGVLRITIPRSEAAKPRKIAIKS
jgi:HSP20 family protein